MSVIGPRPQLVRDMVFMTDEQRLRHTAKPGLSGLAQVNGRNAISWEDKLEWDLKYIRNISLAEDIKIILATAVSYTHLPTARAVPTAMAKGSPVFQASCDQQCHCCG